MPHLTNYVTEGSRIFLTGLKSRFFPKKYSGSAKEICQQIVEDCWNGHYFQTSIHNFPQFWTRDFGWCCKALLQLGHKERVHQTLRYALNRFQEAGKITTTITPKGKPFDFPNRAVDSLPYLIHSIRISQFPYLSYKKFLNWQIKEFFEEVVDPVNGLVYPEKHFSSMKDFALRKSSCYDNCMLGMLAKDLEKMKLKNPFEKYDYTSLIMHHFWNGKYFYDDLTKQEDVAGDAQVFPFACGVIQNKEILDAALAEVHQASLDEPLPLKYTNKEAKVKFISQEVFMKGYEHETIWTHMGPLYISLLKKTNPELAQEFKKRYTEMIESYGGYLEVLSSSENKVKPFKTPFYYCDRGMLWACNYLTL